MKVVVAAVAEFCPASLALGMEGIKHETHICEGELGYGKLVTDLWQQGEGFILVEHDIVPWPGALEKLWKCPLFWCGYQYPYLGSGALFGSHGCGCVKFSTGLVRGWPDLPTQWGWAQHTWRSLDGLIGKSIVNALINENMSRWHTHRPPVAHVRLPR